MDYSSSMLITPEEEAALTFVNLMLSTTVRLVRLDQSDKPDGVTSGFIVERNDSWYLLAAYHSLKRGRYCLETDVQHDGDPLLLTFDSFNFCRRVELRADDQTFGFSQGKEIDFGWMKIDQEKLSKMLAGDGRLESKPVELPRYLGPLNQRPNTHDFYCYAERNRASIQEASRTTLWREPSFEVGLQFLGLDQERNLYKFGLSEQHRGDAYYRGASGAPKQAC